MSKERFLAFTDAIIAILATIMVLEFRVPATANLSALRELAFPLIAYAITFFQILSVWYNHHQLFRSVKHISRRVYFYNSLWLFVMSLFPFTTSWVGREPQKFLPELLYILVLLAWMGSFHLMDLALRKANPEKEQENMTHTFPAIIRYGIMIVAFVVVWFWPPIGLVSVFLLVLLVQIQIFRTSRLT